MQDPTILRKLTGGPTAMGLGARLAIAELQRRGVDPVPLLQQSGLSADALTSRKRISARVQVDLLELTSRTLHDDCLGLTLAADFDLRETGMLYYVAASSRSLGEALQRLERYVRLANEALILEVHKRKLCRIRFSDTGLQRHLDRHQMEYFACVFLRLCQQFAGREIVPQSVSFVHHRSGSLQRVGKILGSEVRFGARADEMTFEPKLMNLPLVGADPFLNEMMVKLCEDAIALRTSTVSSFRAAVENAIAPLLPHAQATAKMVARQLDLSDRTFHRRLTSEGLSFGEILDLYRRDLAMRYLREDISLSQIVWLLGFQHPSQLSQVCRRWTGKSPTQFRQTHSPRTGLV